MSHEGNDGEIPMVMQAPPTARKATGGRSRKTSVSVDTGVEPVDITGYLLSESSTRGTEMRPQWTQLWLWLLDDGTYVLVKSGRSVKYHADGSTCNTGIRQVVG